MGAAILIAVELTATHWFYLYIVWFVPFVLVALMAAHAGRPPDDAGGARRPSARRCSREARGSSPPSSLLVAGWALTLWVAPWTDERVNDLFVYRTFAAPVLDGGLPYRDVAFEYPPLAAPAIALPGLVGHRRGELPLGVRRVDAARQRPPWCSSAARSPGDTGRRCRAGRHARRRGSCRSSAARVLRTHFDLFPVALVLAALLLLVRDRPRAGFAVLGARGDDQGVPDRDRARGHRVAAWRADAGATRGRARSSARR